jgi:hypothetical protein
MRPGFIYTVSGRLIRGCPDLVGQEWGEAVQDR